MPRIRTVKPEFWSSEQVVNCSRDARLLFIGMWNFCDDQGIHTASLVRLKMEVFPGDNFPEGVEEIRRLVGELLANGLLIEYESGGEHYWQVTGWKHQKIEKPNNKYPLPQVQNKTNSATCRRKVGDQSANTRQPFDHVRESGREGKGREGSGSLVITEGAHAKNCQELPLKSPPVPTVNGSLLKPLAPPISEPDEQANAARERIRAQIAASKAGAG